VFFEAEQAHRVMHQHIGVEHKQLGGTRVLFLVCGCTSSSSVAFALVGG
jgi:hypothetical protein